MAELPLKPAEKQQIKSQFMLTVGPDRLANMNIFFCTSIIKINLSLKFTDEDVLHGCATLSSCFCFGDVA